jgi:protein-tyrosine phosphatase
VAGEVVRWPDFRLPTDRDAALATLRQAHGRAATERVELACGGGIGRTGTALAVLAVLSGADPAEAVPWVRRHHHPRAVETPWQRRWVAGLSRT